MEKEIKYIRRLLIFFMLALLISGSTAIPAETELNFLLKFFDFDSSAGRFLTRVQIAVHQVNLQYPFLLYGNDWLAFAHGILAFLFIGPYKDPVRNKWVIVFGMYACVFVMPFAFAAGYYRHIPVWWRLVDCSFGIAGLLPLYLIYRKIHSLEANLLQKKEVTNEQDSEKLFAAAYL